MLQFFPLLKLTWSTALWYIFYRKWSENIHYCLSLFKYLWSASRFPNKKKIHKIESEMMVIMIGSLRTNVLGRLESALVLSSSLFHQTTPPPKKWSVTLVKCQWNGRNIIVPLYVLDTIIYLIVKYELKGCKKAFIKAKNKHMLVHKIKYN